MKKRHSLTLLEIMIVIVLIGLIGSVIGFNMKGSLEKGKIFKSEQARQQIEDILNLEVAKGAAIAKVLASPDVFLEDSGLIKDGKKYLKDGWSEPFVLTESRGKIKAESRKLTIHEKKQREKFGSEDDDARDDEE